MKKLIFVLFFLSICSVATAEKYAIENDDGSIRILDYAPGSAPLEDVLGWLGASDKTVIKVRPEDEAITVGEPIEALQILGNRVKVNQSKKAEIEAEKQAKEARKKALLKMTDAEYKEAKELRLIN